MELADARRYWWIWAAVIPVALWAIVRLLGLERTYPLVPLIAYTPYVAVAALLVAGVALALGNWPAAAIGSIAALSLVLVVLPRAFGSGADVGRGAAELSVLSANVHAGTADAAALVSMVERHEAELLSIQELTPRFARELARAGIGRFLTYAVLGPRPGAGGSGLYSSLPLRPLVPPPPVTFRMARARVELPGGQALRVVAVHPYPPKRGLVDLWRWDLNGLPSAGNDPPWILAGDFNATLDHDELRELIDSGYSDAGEVTGKGLEPTWSTGEILPPPVTIDHVLADERLGIVDYAVEDLPGSDHRAVSAELALPSP